MIIIFIKIRNISNRNNSDNISNWKPKLTSLTRILHQLLRWKKTKNITGKRRIYHIQIIDVYTSNNIIIGLTQKKKKKDRYISQVFSQIQKKNERRVALATKYIWTMKLINSAINFSWQYLEIKEVRDTLVFDGWIA